MTDYEVSRTTGRCSVSGRAFAEGEEFHSIVIETPAGLERRDIAEECWSGPPPEALCCFKTRLARKEKPARKVFVDDDVLVNFFLRLGDHTDPSKLRFRFVLSLILLRKRLLRYERTLRDGESEFWEMRLNRDKSLHKVFNPALTDPEIEELTGELGTVLSGPWAEDPGGEVLAESGGSGPGDDLSRS